MSKEGCPKCIGGVDKGGESDHLDGKNAGLRIKAEVSIRDYRMEQPAPPKTRARVLRLTWKNKERLSELISKAAREDLRRPGAGDCVAAVRQQKYDKPEIQIV